MRRGTLLGMTGAVGLAAAVWQGSQHGWWTSPSSDSPETIPTVEAVAGKREQIEDATFKHWFPGNILFRRVLSCQDRATIPATGIIPPPNYDLIVLSPAIVVFRDTQSIEEFFRSHNLRATNDDELRDVAYLAFFLLRQQHAELVAAPEPELVLGPDDEMGNDPDLPVRRSGGERLPVAAPLPDSDIFDKQGYEIEENMDRGSAIRGQRMTLGNRIFEIAVYFDRAGQLQRVEVTDTGEAIDPGPYTERELMAVVG